MTLLRITLFVFVLFWMMPMLAAADAETAGAADEVTRQYERDSAPGSAVSTSGRNPLEGKQSSSAGQADATTEEEECE